MLAGILIVESIQHKGSGRCNLLLLCVEENVVFVGAAVCCVRSIRRGEWSGESAAIARLSRLTCVKIHHSATLGENSDHASRSLLVRKKTKLV